MPKIIKSPYNSTHNAEHTIQKVQETQQKGVKVIKVYQNETLLRKKQQNGKTKTRAKQDENKRHK